MECCCSCEGRKRVMCVRFSGGCSSSDGWGFGDTVLIEQY